MKNNPNKKPVVLVDKWKLVVIGIDFLKRTERFQLLAKKYTIHPHLGSRDNANLISSSVVATDHKTFVETLNTFYKLGTPAVGYLAPEEGAL